MAIVSILLMEVNFFLIDDYFELGVFGTDCTVKDKDY